MPSRLPGGAPIEKNGYSADGIRTGLKNLKDYPGVNGIMSFAAADNVVQLPLRFTRFNNGKWEPFTK